MVPTKFQKRKIERKKEHSNKCTQNNGLSTVVKFSLKISRYFNLKIQRYPAAAAPAKPKDEWDYEGEFWTSWYNTDTPSDEIEDETLQRIQTRYRKDFQEQKKLFHFIKGIFI